MVPKQKQQVSLNYQVAKFVSDQTGRGKLDVSNIVNVLRSINVEGKSTIGLQLI